MSGFKEKKKKEKLVVMRSRSRKKPETVDYFTLLFCRGRQRNVPKCKTHVQSDCFCSLSLLFSLMAFSLPSPSSFPNAVSSETYMEVVAMYGCLFYQNSNDFKDNNKKENNWAKIGKK